MPAPKARTSLRLGPERGKARAEAETPQRLRIGGWLLQAQLLLAPERT